MRIGFVGLGQMGLPMAGNLARAHDVIAWDRNAERRPEGAARAEALAGVAAAPVVILCLPDGKVVEQVLLGDLLPALGPGTVVVDCSTTPRATALRCAEALGTRGMGFLDAPVSGMRARAEDATLTMMVGGEADALERVRPALDAMASTVLHMGPVGAGQLTKLVNQLLFDINCAALAEVLPMAVKLGLDPAKTVEVVNGGTGRSYASEFFGPRMLTRDFDEGYPMGLAYKDLIEGAAISANEGIPMPVLAAATATYQQALREGLGEEEKGAMVKVFERLLGVEVKA